MATMKTLEVVVLVDANGDYAVGTSAEDAANKYGDEIGAVNGELGLRLVELTVTVPLPETIVAEVTVPDPGDETPVVAVKAA